MPGTAEETPKQACERLLGDIIKFAKHMLENHGEFLPYAGGLTPAGEYVEYLLTDAQNTKKSQEVLAQLDRGLRSMLETEGAEAIALVVNGVLRSPNGSTKDAIVVGLEHRSGYSVNVFCPYRIDGKEVSYGRLSAGRRAPVFFSPASPSTDPS